MACTSELDHTRCNPRNCFPTFLTSLTRNLTLLLYRPTDPHLYGRVSQAWDWPRHQHSLTWCKLAHVDAFEASQPTLLEP